MYKVYSIVLIVKKKKKKKKKAFYAVHTASECVSDKQ